MILMINGSIKVTCEGQVAPAGIDILLQVKVKFAGRCWYTTCSTCGWLLQVVNLRMIQRWWSIKSEDWCFWEICRSKACTAGRVYPKYHEQEHRVVFLGPGGSPQAGIWGHSIQHTPKLRALCRDTPFHKRIDYCQRASHGRDARRVHSDWT